MSIDEVIEHSNKTCDMTEKIAKARGHDLESIESKQFWEHYQVREWLKELKSYKVAEEQGLLLKLPCAIGTTVYAVVRECEGDSFECYHTCDTCTWSDTHIKEVIFDIEYIGDVGNWMFLTKEEAEQALAEMKGEEYGR